MFRKRLHRMDGRKRRLVQMPSLRFHEKGNKKNYKRPRMRFHEVFLDAGSHGISDVCDFNAF